MNYYLNALKKYAEFSGRTSRKDYWMFFLINFIISIIINIIGNALGWDYKEDGNILSYIYNLALLTPSLATAVRRLHDADYKGWWILFPIVDIFMLAQKGTPGPNRFGPALGENATPAPSPSNVNTPPVA